MCQSLNAFSRPLVFLDSHVLSKHNQTRQIGLSDEAKAGGLPGNEGVGDPKTEDVDPKSDANELADELEDELEDVRTEVEALHWLPTLSPLSSVHADLSPFWLKKVTIPLSFTTIHAAGWPYSVPQAFTLTMASGLRFPFTTSLNSGSSLIIC